MKISCLSYTNKIPTFSQEKKNKAANKNLAYFGGAGLLLATTAGIIIYKQHKNNYLNQLAKDLSTELKQNITKKHLQSVMTKEELLKELPKLKEQNFIASAENIKNGTFLADLHSHSHHSDGTIQIVDFLNQAAEYGDKVNKINGKKFMVALSDHDGIEGVREALKIIVQNPEKYKNIKFIPATEISFIMPCAGNSERFKRFGSQVEMPEILMYNINPFSKNSKNFFEGIYNKRQQQVKDAIKEAQKIIPEANLSFEEYTKFFNPQEKYCFLNQHWKFWNYIHTKSRVAEIAREQGVNSEQLYSEIFQKAKKYEKDMHPYALSKYINNENIKTSSLEYNPKINEDFKKTFFPQKKDNIEALSPYEIKFEDIVDFAKKENAVLGIAHPGFMMQNFPKDEMQKTMEYYIKKSDGRLKLIEKFHQAYPIGKDISQNELNEYNRVIDKLGLINMGGRDNHTPNLIPKF